MSHPRSDSLLLWGVRAGGALSAAVLLLIVAFVAAESWPALAELGARLVTDPGWHPDAAAEAGSFSLWPMVAGTALCTFGALLLAAPVGVLSAVFLRFYSPRFLVRPFRRVLGLLAGIPSVVYGLWGLVVLVPLVRQLAPPGQGLLTGVLVLAVMIVPTVALLADAALAAVPAESLRGAAALGLTRWGTVWGVAIPAARAGIGTGALLAAARALGETMAVLMVCGNLVQVPDSLFAPVRTLTANIALEMAYALGDHRAALFASGLLLLLMVAVLVGVSARFARRAARA